MKSTLRLVAALVLLATPALADSSWYEVDQGTGTAGSTSKKDASPGRVYQTTVDAGAQSVLINVTNCVEWKVTAILAATTFDVVGCTDATCDDPTVLPSAALSTGDYAWDDSEHPYIRIDNATSTDVARLWCGK